MATAVVSREWAQEETWALMVQGIAALLFGVAAVFWPGLTLGVLVMLISAYVLVVGIVNIYRGIRGITRQHGWIWTLLLGLLQLAAGVYLVRNPGVTLATLVLVTGFVFVARGIFETITAFTDELAPSARVMQVILGLLAFIVGIIVLRYPVASGISFVWVLGLYALISGPLLIAMSVELKNALKKA